MAFNLIEEKINKVLKYWIFKNSIKKPFNKASHIHYKYISLFKENGIHICYNNRIRKDYHKDEKNILIAIESPEVIKDRNWIDPEMKFEAEISFANFYNLKNYYCCRDLYCNNDNYVHIDLANVNPEKTKLVSLIYSKSKRLTGHQFRHQIAINLAKQVDLYGSGTGNHLLRKLDSLWNYKFQIVIENGKYPEYVSEKFFDCLKTKTIPIYWGGDIGIKKMGFDMEGVLSFDSVDELNQIINYFVNDDYYKAKLPQINFNLSRLIELRNENKMRNYLQSIFTYYHQTELSYHKIFNKNHLNLHLD